MRWQVYTKDVDDFGRKPLNNDGLAEYQLIGYEPEPGDVLIFIYPKTSSGLLYIVSKKNPTPWNKGDDVGIYEGQMQLYKKRDQNCSLNQWLVDNSDNNPKACQGIIEYCNKAIKNAA